ncbi:N-acetyllactosaminide beta-1,3-N-acetylglucosaminyltransferase [Striga asiatica]|uniref:N-acetyllactosaminide beta-1,3-N-acetylglucosaminyltransferase n=1 Tax=Striga asiatica TaxID=4170 RepID=A0A5A7PUJ2_STRAF|nr:N-acetyllactosaminide beta-1,3-N-acetylglucosaminyltransferase [Striga asiatica]
MTDIDFLELKEEQFLVAGCREGRRVVKLRRIDELPDKLASVGRRGGNHERPNCSISPNSRLKNLARLEHLACFQRDTRDCGRKFISIAAFSPNSQEFQYFLCLFQD